MNTHTTLSNADRAMVRKAITADWRWNDTRVASGKSASTLTSADCLELVALWGLDLAAILAGDGEVKDGDEVIREIFDAPKPEPVAPVKAATSDLAALDALRSLLGGAVDESKVRAIVDAALAPVLASLGKPILVVDQDGRQKGKELPPIRHHALADLLTCCAARDASGNRVNVWLSGPAGSGKTHAAMQVAQANGLAFGFHGAMTMPHELTGFVDAGGSYHETAFVTRFRDGGVCLLDEVDAGSNEALLALNAALANGAMSLPNGELVPRHADFICIAAANTWGGGATADYIGRAKLDAAFLNRFGFKLAWDYDLKLERALSGNETAAQVVIDVRDAARRLGLKVVITPRDSIAYAAALASGFSISRAAELTYLASLTEDQRAMVRKEVWA